MTTSTRLDPLIRQALVDTCDLLAHSADPHVALLQELDYELSPTGRRVLAALYALALRPGMGDHFAGLVDKVATAGRDVALGYRVDLDGTHTGPCSHAIGCDECDGHWLLLLDQAVDELEYALGDVAARDLAQAAA